MKQQDALSVPAVQGQSPPLWRLLQATAAAVQAMRQGRSLTAQLDTVPAELRPGVQALSFQVLRQLGRATALRQLLASKTPPIAGPIMRAVLNVIA